jgi:hypothetical protein
VSLEKLTAFYGANNADSYGVVEFDEVNFRVD